ncbi:MAG: hypothetical protein DPW16_16385 [Chloroflexi bacterium]|nr:hypothetical protein [Chloroflexota bacterium]
MTAPIFEHFDQSTLQSHWQPLLIGNGQLKLRDSQLICTVGSATEDTYHDAQICDYAHLRRRDYLWRPPLKMTVRAWASHPVEELRGTAGFGFWNQPFMPTGKDLPRLPRAVWFFFGSPPNNMALAKDVPGYGWKAATFDAQSLSFFAMLPLAPLGFLLMRSRAIYQRAWPIAQKAIGVSEKLLTVDIATPHTYELVWRQNSVDFSVDGEKVHHAPSAPRGPLGFIAWIDNQYAIVTPQGRLGFGFIALPHEQSLTLDSIEIQPLEESQ